MRHEFKIPDTPAALERAVRLLESAFPTKLAAGHGGCMHCNNPTAEEKAERERFYTAIRSHKGPRACLPVQTLSQIHLGHGPAIIHGSFRRFAYFVPALLADLVSEDTEDAASPRGSPQRVASLFQEAIAAGHINGEDTERPWTPAEVDTLSDFFATALSTRIGGPTGNTAEALALSETAAVMRAIPERLAVIWASEDAENHLLTAAGFDVSEWDAHPHALAIVAHDTVLRSLERRFHDAGRDSERAQRLSKIEEQLRWLRSASPASGIGSD